MQTHLLTFRLVATRGEIPFIEAFRQAIKRYIDERYIAQIDQFATDVYDALPEGSREVEFSLSQNKETFVHFVAWRSYGEKNDEGEWINEKLF